MLIELQLLHQHFGLQAYFAITHIAHDEVWPRNRNRRYHSDDDLKTTLCYLVLPDSAPDTKQYTISQTESKSGSIGLTAARAVDSKLPTAGNEMSVRARFQRAMRVLGLNPFIHPCQRSLFTPPGKPEEAEPKSDALVSARCKSLYQIQSTTLTDTHQMHPRRSGRAFSFSRMATSTCDRTWVLDHTISTDQYYLLAKRCH